MSPSPVSWIYRLILRLYPPGFRERYGQGILETLERRGREARERGRVAASVSGARELAGLALGLASEWIKTTTNGRTTMGSFTRELRHALRRLIRSPGFTAASVLTLALAIGANTAIYSVVESVVLDPLPYPDSDELVWLDHAAPGIGADGGGLYMTRGLFGFYRENSRTLDEVAIYRTYELTLAGDPGDPRPERVHGVQATWTLFDVLRTTPALGRLLTEDDRYRDGQSAVVITHGLWQRRYGGDPGVLGRIVRIEDVPHEIVGVLPAGFHYPDPEHDLFLPRTVQPGFGGWVERGVARMAAGFTAADVERDLRDLVPRIPDAFEQPFARQSVEDARMDPRIVTLKEHVVGDVRATLWILMGTVGFVLLIACANVANLFLVRGEVRGRELALRRALGGGGWALAGFFLSESLLLGTAGGALGISLAEAGIRGMVALAPASLPRLHEVGIDASVLLFAGGVTLFSALIFGALPLVRSRKGEIVATLKEGSRTFVGAERSLARRSLVVSQVALALVLLVGSGLMIRSFQELRHVNPGFRADGVLTFRLGLPHGYDTPEQAARFHEQLLERLAALPGVETAGAVGCLPLRSGCETGDPLYEEGKAYQDGEIPPVVRKNMAAPGYFRAMGIRLLEGRVLEPADHRDRTGAVVVTRPLAREFWPGESALGKRVQTPGDSAWHTVVGVVEGVRSRGLAREAPMEILYPLLSLNDDRRPVALHYAVRASVTPESLVPLVRREVRALDPGIPISQVESMEGVLSAASAETRFTMVLLVLAGGVALILGLVGIYGVLSYTVSLRRSEIGVRMALGAGAGGVTWMVLGQGARLAVVGVAVGLAGALGLSRVMGAVVYGVAPTDPLTYAGTAALLLAVALAATWVPARRAARVDPAETLRAE